MGSSKMNCLLLVLGTLFAFCDSQAIPGKRYDPSYHSVVFEVDLRIPFQSVRMWAHRRADYVDEYFFILNNCRYIDLQICWV